MQLEWVELNNIKTDSPFFFKTDPIDSEAKKSIAKNGMISPPAALKRDDLFFPLEGQAILTAAKDKKLPSIPIIVHEDLSNEQGWQYAIALQGGQKSLSILDKARIYKQLTLNFKDENIEDLFRLTGEHPSAKTLKFYQTINELADNIKLYLDRYDLSKKQIEALLAFPAELLQKMIHMGHELAIRPVELIEISKMFYETLRAQKITIDQLDKELKIEERLNDASLNRNLKIQKIKQALRNERYPMLTKTNQKLFEEAEKLPALVNVKWAANLEKADFELCITIKNPADVAGLNELFADAKLQNQLVNIAMMLHGDS